MEEMRSGYMNHLNEMARSGEPFLSKALRARLMEGQGPPLSEDDDSLLDIVLLAHERADDREKDVYSAAFKNVLKGFNGDWMESSVNLEETALVSFALAFFESIEMDAPTRRAVKSFLGAFSDPEVEDHFRANVPSLSNGASPDLYGQIERLRLKYARGGGNHKMVLLWMWKDAMDAGAEMVKRNSMILKEMAQTDPSLIHVENELFTFFNQALNAHGNQAAAMIQNTFLRIGRFMDEVHLNSLFFETKQFVDAFLKSEQVKHKKERERMIRFIRVMGFILGADRDAFLTFQELYLGKIRPSCNRSRRI